MATEQIGIIGLGKFGYYLGMNLLELGHQVLGLDRDRDKVARAQNDFTQVFQLDAREKKALEQVNIKDMSRVVVSLGHSMEASILISLYLKEMGVSEVWVKAISSDHEKLLKRIGVDKTFIPEQYAARRLAHQLVSPGIIEYLPMGRTMAIRELTVQAWGGKTLRQLDLTNKHRVQVIAWRNSGDEGYNYIPKADLQLKTGDCLVIVGRVEQLLELNS